VVAVAKYQIPQHFYCCCCCFVENRETVCRGLSFQQTAPNHTERKFESGFVKHKSREMGHPEFEYHFKHIYASGIVTTRVEVVNAGHTKY
jgi:hypothetical protein